MKRKLMWLMVSLSIMAALVIGTTSLALAAGPDNACGNRAAGQQGAGYGQGGIVCNEDITALLNLTCEQIREQRQTGLSLAQIAQNQEVAEEDLVNAIMANRQAFLQNRVEAGTMTQEQADFRLDVMEQNIQAAINRTTLGPPDTRGANGCGQPGDCTGQGQMRQCGQQGGQGKSFGKPGAGVGPGMMQRFGKNAS
jgi:hypothetical protein